MNILKFKNGDRVRVTGGPYHMTKCGKKIKMGERGVGTFVAHHADGKGLLILFDGNNSPSYVYVGPPTVSSITGTVLNPHKISKKRSSR